MVIIITLMTRTAIVLKIMIPLLMMAIMMKTVSVSCHL